MSIHSYFDFNKKKMILDTLKILLKKKKSVKELYKSINNSWKDEEEKLTYWQFRRYLNASSNNC